MKRLIVTCALLLSTGPGIALAASPPAELADLSASTGLTERQLQMVFGAHTAYAEYLTTYEWARQRAIRTLGRERYDALMAGRPIVLDNGRRVAMGND